MRQIANNPIPKDCVNADINQSNLFITETHVTESGTFIFQANKTEPWSVVIKKLNMREIDLCKISISQFIKALPSGRQ